MKYIINIYTNTLAKGNFTTMKTKLQINLEAKPLTKS